LVPQPSPKRDWYKVSVETIQGWGVLVVLITLAAVGYFGYRWWEASALEREATRVLEEDRRLFQGLREAPELERFRTEYDAAWELMEQGQMELDQKRFEQALSQGRRSRELLTSIRDATIRRGAGEARFVTVGGRVEYRRGERGQWEEARSQVSLESGDFVKTSDGGTAEIMFADGALYKVRPNTLFLVSGARTRDGGERAIELQYGWINLNTAQRPSQIATPTAEARVDDDTEAVVVVEEGGRGGSFTAYRGAVEVASADGVRRRIGAMQTVAQRDGALSEALPLPEPPQLVDPDANADFDPGRTQRIVLEWEAVEGGDSYALQVSRNLLFVDNVIDVDERRRTSATLGIQGEGSFLWRVAALTEEGIRGPWSDPRRFRVATGGPRGGDQEPPELVIEEVQSYGAIFIVRGRAEPGSSVSVNGEAVAVSADGEFTKTVQLVQPGWDFIEIRAADAWGNEATQRERVFVENV
jgi:hypothetical protein